MIRLEEVK